MLSDCCGFLHSQTLQSKLEDDVNQEHYTLPCAFVIFRSLRMATTALQVEWDNSTLHMDKMRAPEVSNVIWSNLGVGVWRRYFFGHFLFINNTIKLQFDEDVVLAQMKENRFINFQLIANR